jgi:hypothetical protein
VYPFGSIALSVTFRTEENLRTENVQFDVAEVNLPFNAIIGRLACTGSLWQNHPNYSSLSA